MKLPARLVLASGNRHKVAELRDLVGALAPGVDVIGLDAFAVAPEIEETGASFEDNARLKAEGIAAWLRARGEPADTWVLADDSGVEVDALGGAPGVVSARFAGEHADDEDNNRKLVAELAARGIDRSAARYRCVLALVHDGTVECFAGAWEVEIRAERRGSGGFGYDPHAWIDGGARTVAEVDRPEKAAVSHRGQALRALARWLAQRGAVR